MQLGFCRDAEQGIAVFRQTAGAEVGSAEQVAGFAGGEFAACGGMVDLVGEVDQTGVGCLDGGGDTDFVVAAAIFS